MIKFYSRVQKIEQKSRVLRAWKEGDDVKTETEDLGFYLLLEDSMEYLYVGHTAPTSLKVGGRVAVLITKV
jgi:hypothetical protein